MKAVLIVALAGSAAAAPSFGSFFDALFGGSDNNNTPDNSDLPFPLISSGSGAPYPIPTATDAPLPFPESNSRVKRQAKALHVDYQLAPIAAPAIKKRALKNRQLESGLSALPSFSLLDPNDTPPATEPATSVPTELPTDSPGLPTSTGAPEVPTSVPTDIPSPPTGSVTAPTGGPTAPFPAPTGEAPFPTGSPFPTAPAGTGYPGLPTTLETLTRGPKPTAAPDAPQPEDGEEMENGNAWLSWISDLLTGERGA